MNSTQRNILIWLYGLIAAFVQGGAAAVTASVTVSMIDPEKFNLGNQLHNFFILSGTCFTVSGCLGAYAYLKQSPLPVLFSSVQVTNTVTEKTEVTGLTPLSPTPGAPAKPTTPPAAEPGAEPIENK